MDKRPASTSKRSHSERWTGSSSGFIPGQDLHDHLELKEFLGQVGYCEVWHARDQKGRRDVILKVLPSALTAEVAIDAKAQSEIRHAQALDHPHILKCYQVLHDNTWTAVEMEDLMAHPLSALLEKERAGHFEVGKIRTWTGQLLEAFIHAHEEVGVVHGDLKLSNLAVNEEGGLKVSDFILDHILSQWADKRGYMPEPPGSEAFWSPQILAGNKVSNADDIYAVGACLYNLLAGKPPFSGKDIYRQIETVVPEPPSQKRRQSGKTIPASWEKVILSCLDKDPAKRPPSIRKLAEQLGYTPQGEAQEIRRRGFFVASEKSSALRRWGAFVRAHGRGSGGMVSKSTCPRGEGAIGENRQGEGRGPHPGRRSREAEDRSSLDPREGAGAGTFAEGARSCGPAA